MSGKSSAAKATVHKLNRRKAHLTVVPTQGWDPLAGDGQRKYVKNVRARTPNQEVLIEAIRNHDITFAVGPAGTGKTYLAVAEAVRSLESGAVSKIIISRPVVEAGEKLGFLPGDLIEKMGPWMRPIYDALSERMGAGNVRKYLRDGVIEIAPVAYMRGRTISRSFIIVDEAQNLTFMQIKMLLTRLGADSTMVITGDPDQSDLLPGVSGLAEAVQRLESLEGLAVVSLQAQDIVRHPLVAAMMPRLA